MYLVPSVLKFLLLLVILFRSLLITLSLSPDSQNSIKESVNTLPATTLPDLNFPPPPEEDPERVQDSLPKSSTEKIERKRLQARIRYHKMVERKKSDGTFAAWKEAKLKSLKDYKDSMPIDKKAIYTQKQVQRQRKRVAESPLFRRKRRDNTREAVRRLRARQKAKQQGVKESTENTKRQRGPQPLKH